MIFRKKKEKGRERKKKKWSNSWRPPLGTTGEHNDERLLMILEVQSMD
jgi:hypothetical protein